MGKLLEPVLRYTEVKKLLDDGESIDQNKQGFNALHAAALFTIDMHEKIELLVARGVNVNAQAKCAPYDNTPLHILIVNEAHEHALFLLKKASKKIDFSVVDSEGKTTLIMAIKVNASSVALALLDAIRENVENIREQAVLLDMQDQDGMTALHYACLYGNQVVAETLIACGASVNIKNKEMKNPIDCLAGGADRIKQALISVSIDPERDEKALTNNFRDIYLQPIFILLQGKRRPDAVDLQSKKENVPHLIKILSNPLIVDNFLTITTSKIQLLNANEKNLASFKIHFENQAERLTGVSLYRALESAACQLKKHLLQQNYYSDWLLRMEAASGDYENVSLLLKNCSEGVNQVGLYSKRTALHQASLNGHMEIAILLLEHGADINCQDKFQETPLFLAIQHKHFDLAFCLVMRGADLSLRNKAKKNVLDLLCASGDVQLKQKIIAFAESNVISLESTGHLNDVRLTT